MTKTKNKVTYLLFALLLTCTASLTQAQGGPGGPGPDPDPGPRTNVPFDGGITLIIAAGIAYASKKGYDKKAKAKQQEMAK